MVSLKIAFGSAAAGRARVSLFVLLLLALVIDDDRQAREEQKRRKRHAPVPPRPH